MLLICHHIKNNYLQYFSLLLWGLFKLIKKLTVSSYEIVSVFLEKGAISQRLKASRNEKPNQYLQEIEMCSRLMSLFNNKNQLTHIFQLNFHLNITKCSPLARGYFGYQPCKRQLTILT